MGVYPFMFGAVKDFQPVFDQLVAKDMKEPYDWDAYAEAFLPKAEELVARATIAEAEGDQAKASELYLRASAVYRISRFPTPRSNTQRLAWTQGKKVCLKGLSLRDHPVAEVIIPHTFGRQNEGSVIPAYYQVPAQATPESPVPLVIILCGLDGYRTELSVWMEGWRRKNCASLVMEIPGTGDCPADPQDPASPDRVFSSVFYWLEQQSAIVQRKIIVWGFSTGGYYAIRLAHTHPDTCAGVVALGGGCHYMFDPDWLDKSNHMEYPFDLGQTLCHKFGYGNDFARFQAEAMDRFSLLRDGTLDRPTCARLLLVNGTDDSIFPVDDYYLALQHGEPKEVRLVPNTPHMGEPQSFVTVLKWIYKILDIAGDPWKQLSSLPFRPQY